MRILMIAVWIAMVMTTSYTLFHITFQVEALENRLADLNTQIRAEQERIHSLRAEWSYTSRPDWIEGLGKDYLPGLIRMSPSQVLRIEDIPFHRIDALSRAGSATFPEVPEGSIQIVPAAVTAGEVQ